MTWNVQHASPSRAAAQAAWLAREPAADLVVLTEVGHGPGGTALCQVLHSVGYQAVVAPRGSGGYRTVLASRHPGLSSLGSLTEILPERTPLARITLGQVPVLLAGLYIPSRGPKERRNADKRAVQHAVAQALPGLGKNHPGLIVVAGDLNVVPATHTPHHRVFGQWEYDFYDSFAAAGLVDAHLALSPEAHDHSWFGRSGAPYRFDYGFVSSHHTGAVTACTYLHEPRVAGLSDHSALSLIVELHPRTPVSGVPAPAASLIERNST
nr:endonuclease/exonuclease/phosphatase family protein [Streptomyces sp. NBC_00899]